jgi:hypothetical protein
MIINNYNKSFHLLKTQHSTLNTKKLFPNSNRFARVEIGEVGKHIGF